MKLVPRNRRQGRRKPRITISQEEITADLLYPATRRAGALDAVPAVRARSRR